MDDVTWLGLVAAAALTFAPAGASQQIYKWVDEKGVTQYTTTPPPGGKAQTLKTQPATGASSAAAKSWQEQEIEFRTRQAERASAQRKQDEAERGAEQRRAACASAQRDLRILQEQQRIYTLDEKGERQYMEDAQRAEIARKTRAFLDRECVK